MTFLLRRVFLTLLVLTSVWGTRGVPSYTLFSNALAQTTPEQQRDETPDTPPESSPETAAGPAIKQEIDGEQDPEAGGWFAPGQATGTFVWPCWGPITTRFSVWHPGIDIACSAGTPLVAADTGVVIGANWDRTGYGNRVVVDHRDGWSSTYNHLVRFNVVVGQVVRQGQVVGFEGSTGHASGAHVHFELRYQGRFVNPLGLLR